MCTYVMHVIKAWVGHIEWMTEWLKAEIYFGKFAIFACCVSIFIVLRVHKFSFVSTNSMQNSRDRAAGLINNNRGSSEEFATHYCLLSLDTNFPWGSRIPPYHYTLLFVVLCYSSNESMIDGQIYVCRYICREYALNIYLYKHWTCRSYLFKLFSCASMHTEKRT